jgi:hypothetical protein
MSVAVHTMRPSGRLPLLLRRQSRYDLFCASCHDRAGGNGAVGRRGDTCSPSLHRERVVAARIGRRYSVISIGLGATSAPAAFIPPPTAWPISTCIRALQRNQRAAREVPESERRSLCTRPEQPPGGLP